MCKLDLKDAFFHLSINTKSRYVTAFDHDNEHYQFCVLPFGLSVSPYYMQMLTNIIVTRFRELGLVAWGHIDDYFFELEEIYTYADP